MNRITVIDRPALKTIQETLVADMAAIAAKLGLTVTIGGLSTSDGQTANVSIKFTLDKQDGATGAQLTPQIVAWNEHAERFGLDKSWLGKQVDIGRPDKATIVGLEPNRPANPIVVQTVRGKNYVIPAEKVIAQLGNVVVVGLTEQIKSEFASLANRLSPENLSCDGECSRAQVSARRAQIDREWRALEQRAGRKINIMEAEDFAFRDYSPAA